MNETGLASFFSFWKSRNGMITGILLLGLFLRFLSWRMDPVIMRDSVGYLRQAQQWAETGRLISDQPPLFIFLLKLLYQAGLEPLFWGRVLNILFGMVFVLSVIQSAEVLFPGKPVVLCIGLFAAVHPTLISLSVQILRDMPYLAVMGMFIRCFLISFRRDCERNDDDVLNSVFQGGLLAIGCFFRHEAWFALFFFVLYQIVSFFVFHRRKMCMIRVPLVFAVFFSIFLFLGILTDFYGNCQAIYISQYKESFGR